MAQVAFMGLGGFMLYSYLIADRSNQEGVREAYAMEKRWADIKPPMVFGSIVNTRYAGQLNQDVDMEFISPQLTQELEYQDYQFNVEENQEPMLDDNMLRPCQRNPSISVFGSKVISTVSLTAEAQDLGFAEIQTGAPDFTKPGVILLEEIE